MPEHGQCPRQRSTCPASQGLPGAGGKGGPEVKGLSPAGPGLWQAIFRSACPVSGKGTRPEGSPRPSPRLPRVCGTKPPERAAPLGESRSPRQGCSCP